MLVCQAAGCLPGSGSWARGPLLPPLPRGLLSLAALWHLRGPLLPLRLLDGHSPATWGNQGQPLSLTCLWPSAGEPHKCLIASSSGSQGPQAALLLLTFALGAQEPLGEGERESHPDPPRLLGPQGLPLTCLCSTEGRLRKLQAQGQADTPVWRGVHGWGRGRAAAPSPQSQMPLGSPNSERLHGLRADWRPGRGWRTRISQRSHR